MKTDFISSICSVKGSRAYSRLLAHAWLLSMWAISLAATPAMAATWTVNSTGDTTTAAAGNCNASTFVCPTLRDAVAAANADSGDTITFDASLNNQTITLSAYPALADISKNQLEIKSNMTITGPGASKLTISGGGYSRLFLVDTGVTATISRVTITGGNRKANGGAIYNNGLLTVTDSAFTNNTATTAGGAIYSSPLTATSTATVTVNNSVFSGNTAAYGGAIYNYCSNVTVNESTFTNNSATNSTQQGGGAILNYSAGTFTAVTTVNSSTFTNNTAAKDGGAIHNYLNGVVNVTNSTFTGNSAANGGAIYIHTGSTLKVINSTLTGNSATDTGGGIYNDATLKIANSIVSNNTGSSGYSNIYDDIVTTTNRGGNVLGDDTSISLAPLGNYGGSTQTMPPLPGSPARCAGTLTLTTTSGNTDLSADLTTDQRGFTVNSSCASGTDYVDAGAVQTHWLEVTNTNGTADNSEDCNSSGTGSNCSLDGAITLANTSYSTTGADIIFASGISGTIAQTTALPAISGLLNLANLEGRAITIDGGGLGSVLQVETGSTAAISNLTLTNGSATVGGGIRNAGTLTVTNTTISGNTATTIGGGIHNSGTLMLDESTLTANTATTAGGGIHNAGTLTVASSTINGNTTTGTGGGIENAGTATIFNSIVAGNTSSTNDDDCDSCGTQSSYNLINTTTSAVTPPTLSTLQSNGTGAVTNTMIPLPGSTAICAGSSSLLLGDAYDQRGFPRRNTTTGYSSSSPCVDLGAVQTNYSGIAFASALTDSVFNTELATAPKVEVDETNTNTSMVNAVNGVPVTLTFSGGSSEITGTLTATTSGGVATFSGLKVNTIGTGYTFSTADIAVTSAKTLATITSNTFAVADDTMAGFTVVPASTVETVGMAFTVTVTAIGRSGHTWASYTGTPTLISSDNQTVNAMLDSSTSGVYTYSVRLDTQSTSSGLKLTAKDSSYTGTSSAIMVTPPLSLTPAAGTLTGGATATAYSQKFAASGGSGNYSYALTGSSSLPSGLSLDTSTGVLSGTPTQSGSFSFTVTATDTTYTAKSVSASYSVSITPTFSVLNITDGNNQTAYVSTLFSTPQQTQIAQPLQVQAVDAYGNPISGLSVVFTAPSSGASLLFDANQTTTYTIVTDSNGSASAYVIANSTAGSYAVTAAVNDISASFNLTNRAMPVYTVTTLMDDATGIASNCTDQLLSGATPDSACSLRDAIAASNAIGLSTLSIPLMPTINFSASALGLSSTHLSIYSVKNKGKLVIDGNMKIVGPGAGLLSIDGGGTNAVFEGNPAVTYTVSLSGLTIAAVFLSV
jgi:predicted outer membrane repeat protein